MFVAAYATDNSWPINELNGKLTQGKQGTCRMSYVWETSRKTQTFQQFKSSYAYYVETAVRMEDVIYPFDPKHPFSLHILSWSVTHSHNT